MKTLFFVLVLVGATIVAVMLINDEKPSAALKRIEEYTLAQLHLKVIQDPTLAPKAAEAAPTQPTGAAPVIPSPTPEAVTQPPSATPKPDEMVSTQPSEATPINPNPSPEVPALQVSSSTQDLIAWLIGHPKELTQEIKIKQNVEFPAVYEGKVIGSIKKPPGTSVKIIEVHPTTVAISFNGGSTEVPIQNTDLLEVAKTEMEKQSRPKEQPISTAESSAVLSKEPQLDVISILDKPVINIREISDLFAKKPSETANYLHSKIIKLSGLIERIQILGMDSDRVELTLNSQNQKRFVLRLKLENLINKSTLDDNCKNKLSLENGQLKLISELVRSGNSYYYYYWNGYQYIRSYYYGGYYDGPYGYRHSRKSQALESPICTEGSEVHNWSAKLHSTNSASVYFDVIKL